ncbi:phosphoribosyltransferase [Verrucomicrobium spinosum]|uniref:phosphoribosyltransferase n=1 Tax=Verrucomicrobium spinosum TaxID=2736 RepID=UPI00094612E2|nr:phosphoribosyltransferase [Verrucomicrobium spinosum]
MTPISTGTIQASLDDVTDPVLLEKLEKENQGKFDEVREAKGSLGSPDDVGARNHGQKAFVDQFYKKAAYEAIMKDLRGDVVFLAMPSSSERNRIPVYLAQRLKEDFGGIVVNGSAHFYRANREESKKNTTYLAKMAMQDFEVSDPSWKDQLKGKRVVLVDDIITTGDSLDSIAQKLKSEGVEVEKVVSLVAHNSGRGIHQDTVEKLMKQINSKLADQPVQKIRFLTRGLENLTSNKKPSWAGSSVHTVKVATLS